MTSRLVFGTIAAVALLCGVTMFAVTSQTKVSPEAIQSSVTRTPDLIERAWTLPVAATFASDVTWQSNGSLCGPASVANAFRSMGEEETTEAEVLEDTGKCWTGICFMGLTLDELADVARAHTERKVTVVRDVSAEGFREHMRQSNDPDRCYIVNSAAKKYLGLALATIRPSAAISKPRTWSSFWTSTKTTSPG